MSIEIRRTLTWVQTTYEEGGKSVPVPTKLVSAIAIIKNPWFGRAGSRISAQKFKSMVQCWASS